MRYSIRTSNYLKRVELTDPTYMMSMANHVTVGVEPLRIDSGCSLEKDFTKLIHMNPIKVIIPNCERLRHVTIVYVVLLT